MSPALPFDLGVPAGGYAWWYLDAVADDAELTLSLIFLVGSVFSPRYHRALRHGLPAAECFCAVNLALNGPRQRLWVMSEWPRARVTRAPERLTIGESELGWVDGRLRARVDERTSPFPSPRVTRVRGEMSFEPACAGGGAVPLDEQGEHLWAPIAPLGRIAVRLEEPRLRFEGSAYHDGNAGRAPLAEAFRGWSWARFQRPGEVVVAYDGVRRDNSRFFLERTFGAARAPELAPHALPRSGWGLTRGVRAPATPRVLRELENGPFYARALLDAGPWRGIHEQLALDRFRTAWVQALLPFRVRRVAA